MFDIWNLANIMMDLCTFFGNAPADHAEDPG